jgi:hypothetical protein
MRIKSSVRAGNGSDCRFFGLTRRTRPHKHGLVGSASLSVLLLFVTVSIFNASAQPFMQAWGWNGEGECNVAVALGVPNDFWDRGHGAIFVSGKFIDSNGLGHVMFDCFPARRKDES